MLHAETGSIVSLLNGDAPRSFSQEPSGSVLASSAAPSPPVEEPCGSIRVSSPTHARALADDLLTTFAATCAPSVCVPDTN